MNFCEHCHRVKEQRACNWDGSSSPRPRILGFLIGVEHEQTVEIFTSIELVVEPISGTLERAFLEKNQELNKILFPAFDILGWYCTGMMYETDMQIHKALMGVNGRAFLLLLDDVEHFSVRNINRGMIILGNAALTVGESPLTFGTTHYTIEAVEIDEWKTTSNVFARSGEEREDASEAFRTMLFETPSGFTMFGIAEQVFEHPEIIWAWFAHRNDTKYVISTLGFIKVEKKPAEWNSDVGLGKDLEQFIQEKFSNRRKPLVVQNVQLKHAIEKELNIKCWFNSYIVRELTWGLNFTLDLLVPEEKEYQVFPLSIGLEKKIKTYGFDVSPQIIDRQFVNAVGFLNYLEFAWEKLLLILHDQFDHCFIESISDDEFPKVIESKLFSQEIVPKGGQYNRHDILNFLSLVLGIPDQKRVTMAHLKNMEAARLENVEAAWFENVEVAPLENVAAAISEDQSAASKSAAISEDQSAASKDSFSVSVAFICWTIFSLGFSIASIVTR